jgi:hypothetical protein
MRIIVVVCLLTSPIMAQHRFLGAGVTVEDKRTPLGILYNDRGYDNPPSPSISKLHKWQAKGVPPEIIEQLVNYHFDPLWIDEGWNIAKRQFINCGGALAAKARTVDPRRVKVILEPTGFTYPRVPVPVAALYDPNRKEIHSVPIFYHWGGPHKGWLRHAKDLLVWEWSNYVALEVGVQPEPKPQGWPCNAPRR